MRAAVDAYLRTGKPVRLPVVTVNPAVTTEEAQRVADEIATPALEQPMTITAKGKKGSAKGRYDLRWVLSFKVQGNTLVPVVAGGELHKMMASDFGAVEQPGRDATYVIKKKKPVLVPSSKALCCVCMVP